MKKVKDMKVIPGEECFWLYKLLFMDLMIEHRAVTKFKISAKVKLWRLEDEKIKRILKDAMKDAKEEPESWEDGSKYIMNVAKRIFVKYQKVVIIEKQHDGGIKKVINE